MIIDFVSDEFDMFFRSAGDSTFTGFSGVEDIAGWLLNPTQRLHFYSEPVLLSHH